MDRLKTLTEQLYKDGVEKGRHQAEGLLTDAKKEAEKLIASAKIEAEQIVAKASRDATEAKRKLESEMVLTAKQSISKLKGEITEMISLDIAKQISKDLFSDKEFVKNLFTGVASTFGKEGATVSVPKDQEQNFRSYMEQAIKHKLDGSIELNVSESVKGGFKVAPKDGSFAVVFNEESFNNFFKEYLKPTTREILFREK